jgi:hypothetical protein
MLSGMVEQLAERNQGHVGSPRIGLTAKDERASERLTD